MVICRAILLTIVLVCNAAAGTDLPSTVESSPPVVTTQPTNPLDVLPGGASVAVIKIEDLIYDFTLESLRRRVDKAIARGANLIVIELKTKGGMVTSGLDIAKYIKGLQVPTVAWINNEAYSAGILIGSACDIIVMSRSSATGDCAPISPGKELAPTERAKILSPILEEFRGSAKRNNYDYVMFHAMCELGVEVYRIEHRDTAQRMLVNQADYEIMVKGKTREQVEQLQSQTATPDGTKAPPINLTNVRIERGTDAQRGQWQLVDQIHDGRTLLTVNQDRALDIGLSKATISTEAELAQFLRTTQVSRVKPTWSENLAGWLVHPAVRAVLMLGLMLGLYVELQSPGLGLPGAVAAIALVLLIGAPFLVGLAEVWHVLLIVAGVALLFVEVFVTTGFGVIGACGLVAIFAGLVLGIVPTTGSGPMNLPAREMYVLLQHSLIWMLIGFIGSAAGLVLITMHFGKIPGVNRLTLQAALVSGSTAAISGDEAIGGGTINVGDTGRVVFELRPTGRAQIEGRVVDVVSCGDWIEPGNMVRVVEVQGNRIVVDQADA